jgi:flagellar hook-associated protein 3 FlgL
MIGRVTQQGLQRTSLINLQGNLSRMSTLQQQLSSGKALTKPSDDPAGMVDAMRIRSDKRANAQYARNTADGVGWLTTASDALANSAALLRRARDLTVQGANAGALSPAAREALASEITATRDAIREQGNTSYNGRLVFAGTSNAPEAFGPTGAYVGSGAPVERRISEATTVRVDVDGSQAFGDVFTLLDNVATALTTPGADVGSYLDDIDARLDTMLKEVASVGTRHNQVNRAQETIKGKDVTLQTQLSSVEDVDLAETIVKLQMQEVAYQSALSATSRTLQPSLLDFLR